ncbi:MAG: hypothetical protein KF716_22200 [Anaerolineae bacterium]|nr:hypothetical protein [Anaerolineae bacterium]
MTRLVCLKCGSTKIDDGSSKLVSVLGFLLFLAGSYVLSSYLAIPVTVSWEEYAPIEDANCLPALLTCCFGIFMFFQGLTQSERVRCRKCGSLWTPPKPPKHHLHRMTK